MSELLKLLASIVMLALGVGAPVYAGTCNKSHPDWDTATKTCKEKPVVLRREAPKPAPAASAPSSRVTEVFLGQPEPPELPRSELVLTSKNRSEIPGRTVFVEGLMVSTCHGFVRMPDVGWTTRPSIVESSSYELRAIPARGNNPKE